MPFNSEQIQLRRHIITHVSNAGCCRQLTYMQRIHQYCMHSALLQNCGRATKNQIQRQFFSSLL